MTYRLALTTTLLAAALAASPAHAQPAEADRATARSLAAEGYRALKRQDYAVAEDRFRRADALVHAPTLVVDWARALTGLGKLVEAEERYALVLREGVPASAPRSWTRALADAQREIDALRPRLAWLTLDVYGPQKFVVTIDGVRLPDAALGVARATNPGTRAVLVEAEGYAPEARSVRLAEGSRERVEITLAHKPTGVATGVTPLRQQPAPRREVRADSDNGFAYASLAIGGLGLATGAVTGALALSKHSDLDAVCNGGSCPASSRDDIDAYHRLGIASGIGFGVGVIGLGTGLTLLLTQSGDPAREARGVRPYIGLGSVGAMGGF